MIIFASEPPDAESATQKGLLSVKSRTPRGPWTLFSGHPVYNIPLSAIRRLEGTEKAELLSWRYLVRAGKRTIGAAEVNPQEDRFVFASFNQGPYVKGTERVVEWAGSQQDLKRIEYEFRVLRLPSLYVMALWLHAQDDRDWIIPMDLAPAHLKAHRKYTSTEFCEALAPLVRSPSQVPWRNDLP